MVEYLALTTEEIFSQHEMAIIDYINSICDESGWFPLEVRKTTLCSSASCFVH